FTDGSTICDLVSSPGSISRADQQALTNIFTTAFFAYYLQGDASMLPWLCGDSVQAMAGANTLTFQTNINCSMTAVDAPAVADVVVFPQPATSAVALRGVKLVEVYAVSGERVVVPMEVDEMAGEVVLDVRGLGDGVYVFRDLETGKMGKFVKW
ncbi:MAG: hypothetical protein AAF570_28160, partial [Bacteroidota bacterium]